jgi:hypothetical protein
MYTFLLYLNDEFEGGETTFFMPAPREGTLNGYPVVGISQQLPSQVVPGTH